MTKERLLLRPFDPTAPSKMLDIKHLDTKVIFELLRHQIGIIKNFNTVNFFDYIKKNNALHLLQAAFCLLVRL